MTVESLYLDRIRKPRILMGQTNTPKVCFKYLWNTLALLTSIELL